MEDIDKKIKTRNQTMDVVRILACFMVVLCHVSFPGDMKFYSKALSRFAVPLFMMISGWYLRKDSKEETLKNAKRFFFKLLKFTIISTIYVVVINTVLCIIKGKEPFSWFTWTKNSQDIIDFFRMNKTLFLNGVLWYLFAMLYMTLIYMVLTKFNLLRFSYYMILPAIIINLIENKYYYTSWVFTSNWILFGIPFVLLGSYLKSTNWCRQIPTKVLWAFVIIGIIITLIEVRPIDQDLYIGNIPLLFGIFALAVKGEYIKYPKLIPTFGAKCTPIIYVVHLPLINLLYAIFGKPQNDIIIWIMPFVAFLLSSIIAITIVYVKGCFHKKKQITI